MFTSSGSTGGRGCGRGCDAKTIISPNTSNTSFGDIIINYYGSVNQSEIIGQRLGQNNINFDCYIKRGYGGGGGERASKTFRLFLFLLITTRQLGHLRSPANRFRNEHHNFCYIYIGYRFPLSLSTIWGNHLPVNFMLKFPTCISTIWRNHLPHLTNKWRGTFQYFQAYKKNTKKTLNEK